jgi:hypothetical protein
VFQQETFYLLNPKGNNLSIIIIIIVIVNSINYVFMAGSVAVMTLLEVLYQQMLVLAEEIPLPHINIYIYIYIYISEGPV